MDISKRYIHFHDDPWVNYWTNIFLGPENDSILHVCDEVETIKCVDCAKEVHCWNDNDIYKLCNECLFVEDTLDINQFEEADED